MFISGLGNVRGLGPMTKICVSRVRVVAMELDEQWLSLFVQALLSGNPTTPAINDNLKLRNRLFRLNPKLRPRRSG